MIAPCQAPPTLFLDFDAALHPASAGSILLEDGEMKIVGSALFLADRGGAEHAILDDAVAVFPPACHP